MNTTKLLFVLATVAAAFITQPAKAKIWRVNNNGYSADFISLQVANKDNKVLNGDSIHLEGSATSYGNITITKKLVIIGPGYFLTENKNSSSNALQATVDYIEFEGGSQGSQLIGVYVSGIYGITVDVGNILIKRCKIDYSVHLNYDIADVRVLQNYFTNTNQSNTSAIVPSIYGFPTDFVFNNNISRKTLLAEANNVIYTLLECKNNVFDCPAVSGGPSIKMNAGSFQNNIITNPAVTTIINFSTGTGVSYNVSASANNQFGTNDNNIVVADMATLFASATNNSTDGKYTLRPGSPASNNGSDGTDRGAFGGLSPANRYTLSGLPAIPVIYEINTSGVAGPGGLQVTIKAKTIK